MVDGKKFSSTISHCTSFIQMADQECLLLPLFSMERNYEIWQPAVRTALKAKKKLGFINGTLIKPILEDEDDPSEFNTCHMVNSLVCSWIINVKVPKLQASIALHGSDKGYVG